MTRLARKEYTCDLCEQRISKGERHYAETMFPGRADVDYIYTFRCHMLCRGFWLERIYPEWGDAVVWDWEEAQREFGWDDWFAQRSVTS